MPEGSHGHPVRSAMIEDTPYRWPLTAVVGWILSRDPAVVLELCEATAGDQAAVLLRAAHGQGEAVEDAWRALAFEFATNEETAWDYGDGRRPPQLTPGPEWDEFVARIKADPGWVVTRDQVLDVWLPDPIPTDRDPDPCICLFEMMDWLIHGANVANDTDDALKEMRRAFLAGEIELFGLRGGDGEPQKIPKLVGANAEIDPVNRALLRLDRPYEHHPWREIFSWRKDFLQLYSAADPIETKRETCESSRGHKAADEGLMPEMARLVEGGATRWEAALRVADKAKGGGTPESKAKRLHRRHKEWTEKKTENR